VLGLDRVPDRRERRARPRERGRVGDDRDVDVGGEGRLDPCIHRVAADERVREARTVEDRGEQRYRIVIDGHGR
jgi:hypothetical protein